MNERLVVTAVTKHLAGSAVLRGASLSARAGEIVALVGDNGAGKSTLLRVVAGVLDADRGEVAIDGFSLRKSRTDALARLGYVPERPDIPEHLRAVEWLDLVAALKRVPRIAPERIEELGVGTYVHQRVGSLSLGQHRRVALAAACLGEPLLLALDEPTNGLDRDGMEHLARFLEAHAKRGGAVLLATHDGVFAGRVATRTRRLEAGAVT